MFEITSSERLAFAKITDLISQRRKAYSDFLDPAKAEKFYALLSKNKDINIYLFGGHESAERKMLGVCPSYMEISEDEFPIDVLRISYNTRFSRELVHRDFLGSILGLGIDRSRVGDVVITDGVAHAFVCKEISEYILTNLERVGSAKVTAEQGNAEGLSVEAGRELMLNMASPRLDAVISAAFRLSRAKAAAFITGEKVFVNWVMNANLSKQIEEGDVITVRGLGRLKILEFCGRTKKDRLTVRALKY